MPDENQTPAQEPIHESHYERRDISVAMIVRWIIVLFIVMGGSAIVTKRLYDILAPGTVGQARSKLAYFPPAPAGPRLQPEPRADIATFRAHEDAELNSFAWVDRKTGTLRIPVDLALDIIARRGLPTPPALPMTARPAAPLSTAGEPPIRPGGPLDRSIRYLP